MSQLVIERLNSALIKHTDGLSVTYIVIDKANTFLLTHVKYLLLDLRFWMWYWCRIKTIKSQNTYSTPKHIYLKM